MTLGRDRAVQDAVRDLWADDGQADRVHVHHARHARRRFYHYASGRREGVNVSVRLLARCGADADDVGRG